MPRIKTLREPCGCMLRPNYSLLCAFHYNEMMLKMRLDNCRMWEDRGRLDPNDPADAVVLRFYRDLVYWAAKGATAAGGVVKL